MPAAVDDFEELPYSAREVNPHLHQVLACGRSDILINTVDPVREAPVATLEEVSAQGPQVLKLPCV
jgi:hypothetical protein